MTGIRQLVEEVRALPYGRPSDRTVEGMLREGRLITIDATFPGEPWDGRRAQALHRGALHQ